MRKPRVLFFDIETSPILAYIWRTGNKISVDHSQIKKGQYTKIICICYKFLGEREVHSLDFGLNKQDSSAMIEKFTKIIESADIVIGHNADEFDIKHLNSQRLILGQEPINWPTSEDTLKQFRKYFAFPSYRLDYLSKTLVGAGKDKMYFQDWVDIIENKKATALAKMIRYCKKDVRRLEQIFSAASKFFTPKVHRGLLMGKEKTSCPHCGSDKVHSHGIRATLAAKYQRLKCYMCGHWFKGKKVS